MKKIILSLILFFCFSSLCFSQPKEIQFRLVLTKHEAETALFDIYNDEHAKDLPVSTEVLLSNKDIESMGVSKNASGVYQILVKFNEAGRKKYTGITTKNMDRQLAVIISGKLLTSYYIREVVNTGQALLPADSLYDGEELIKSLGFTPYVKYQF